MKLTTIPGSPEERDAIARHWNQHAGLIHAGARVDLSDPDEVRVVILPMEAHHRGGMGSPAANGAVLAGMFDVAIGIVGNLHAGGRRAGTVQLSMQFLRPLNGDSIAVGARLVRAGATLVFVSAEARDAQGVVCARAEGIVAVIGGEVPDRGK